MAKGRNPEFIKVEKFINSGKGTIADYRKLNPGSPEFKVKIGSIANKNAIVSYKKAGTKDAVTRRAAQIKKNRPTDEVFDEGLGFLGHPNSQHIFYKTHATPI